MKLRKTAWMLAAVLGITLIGTGCSGQEKEEEKEPEVEYETIGQESEEACEILLTNGTGSTITGLAVKSSADAGYPANMMTSEQKFEADETVDFFFTPEYQGGDMSESGEETADAQNGGTAEDETQSADASEDQAPIAAAQINVTYSLQMSMEDGSVYELTSFPVEDMEEAELKLEDGVAFVAYTSTSEEVEINTKETELAVKADKDAAKTVDDQIQAVGEVTLDSESAIQAARAAYDALTDVQKQYVANVQLLTDQENTLASLKQAAAEQAAAEQAAAEAAAAQAAAEAAAAQSWSDQSSGYTDYGYSDPGYSSGGSTSGGASSGVSQSSGSCLGDVLINN